MKDNPIFEDKRKQKSKDVIVRFDNPTDFRVLDENQETKYLGKIDIEKNVDDECSCDSFCYGMKFEKISDDSEKIESRYMAEHGTAFQCKHIIRAKNIRKLGWTEDSQPAVYDESSKTPKGKGDKI